MLKPLKQIVARVEVEGSANGTAFLVGRRHVATALHVLHGRSDARVVFVDWDRADRARTARRVWRHPSGYDVAILELDRECPEDVDLLPCRYGPMSTGARWMTFGFPTQVPEGHPLSGEEQRISDPQRLVESWELRILQLHTPSAYYELGGFSGAPCVVGGAVVGVITHQLRRALPDGTEKCESKPSLDTVFALPAALLVPSGVVAAERELPEDVSERTSGRGRVPTSDSQERVLRQLVEAIVGRCPPDEALHVDALMERLLASDGHAVVRRSAGFGPSGHGAEAVIEEIGQRVIRPDVFTHGLLYLSKRKLRELAETRHKSLFVGRQHGSSETAPARLEVIHEHCLWHGQVRFLLWPPTGEVRSLSDELCFVAAELVVSLPATTASELLSPGSRMFEVKTSGQTPELTMMVSRRHMEVSSLNFLALEEMLKGNAQAVLACGFLENVGYDYRFHPLALSLLHASFHGICSRRTGRENSR